MAKLIFIKNSENSIGTLYRIAQDQNFLDLNKNFNEDDFSILEITADEFNDIKNGVKGPLSYEGTTVTYDARLASEEPEVPFPTEASLKTYINELLEYFEVYLKSNSSKPLATTVTSYVAWLKDLDTSSIITPLNIGLEKYASDLGANPVHLLELV